jgi:hypothetical protein
MTRVTVSIWHNLARDQAARRTAPLDGFTPGDPMVRVFPTRPWRAGGPGGDRRGPREPRGYLLGKGPAIQ